MRSTVSGFFVRLLHCVEFPRTHALQPVADPEVRVCDRPDAPGLPGCALVAQDASDSPGCVLEARIAQHLPDSPVAGGDLYLNDDGAFAGGRASG